MLRYLSRKTFSFHPEQTLNSTLTVLVTYLILWTPYRYVELQRRPCPHKTLFRVFSIGWQWVAPHFCQSWRHFGYPTVRGVTTTCRASKALSNVKLFVACTVGIRVYVRSRWETVVGGERARTGHERFLILRKYRFSGLVACILILYMCFRKQATA